MEIVLFLHFTKKVLEDDGLRLIKARGLAEFGSVDFKSGGSTVHEGEERGRLVTVRS